MSFFVYKKFYKGKLGYMNIKKLRKINNIHESGNLLYISLKYLAGKFYLMENCIFCTFSEFAIL